MVDLGKLNSLKPVRDSANGRYLDGGELGEILLPKKFVTEELRQAESISAFVYKDSEDRLVATTETPKAMVGQFATLEVLSANPKVGAFLD